MLVAGAGGPLGPAIIGRLVAEGATVVAAGAGSEVEAGERMLRVDLDPVDAASWQACADQVMSELGALHGLVHAGSTVERHALAGAAPEHIRTTIDTNLLGPALGIAAIAPLLSASGGGSIVTVASTEAFRGAAGAAAFAAANWGLRGLTRSAALELGRQGIRVNTVCPSIGVMGEVEESRPALADGDADRSVTMGDVAAMVAFLLSDDSATCTGGDFLVDAGLTA